MVRTGSEIANPALKRRKLNQDTGTGNVSGGTVADDSDPEHDERPSSSSDELAATSDYELERRRTSWSARKAVNTERNYESRSGSPNGSESPDELAMDAEEQWKNDVSQKESSPSRKTEEEEEEEESRQHSDDHDERTDMNGMKEDGDLEDFTLANDDAENAESNDTHSLAQSDQATPVTAPPPPKPDRVHYVQKHLLTGHVRGVAAVKFSPDRTMIASGGADGILKVWDTLTGKLIHSFEGHLAGISTVAWSPDNETIATGSDDKTIRLWNALTGKAHPRAFTGHHNYVYSIAFSPKGNILASGSYDEAVFLWDVRTAKVMRSLPAHSDPVAGIDVCHDGTLVVSCSSDGLIRIWDTMTGQCLRTLVHEDTPPVMAVRFSPNSKYVLAWTLDDCVRLWDYVRGRCIKTYQGHVNRKYSLCGAFGTYQAGAAATTATANEGAGAAPVHAFAVTGSEDGAIICWDVVEKKILQRLEGHTDVVLGVDTAEINGKRLLASCGLDKTVRVWEEEDEEDDETGAKEDQSDSSQGIMLENEDKMDLAMDGHGERDVNGVRDEVQMNGVEDGS